MRPSRPLRPQHHTKPPLAMSHACIEPDEMPRYLMTITRDTEPVLASLVAVIVTVPRSTPRSAPLTESIVATAGFEVVQRTTRPVSTLFCASRSTAVNVFGSYASTVSSAGATVTVATGTPTGVTVIAAVAVFPSARPENVAGPPRLPLTTPPAAAPPLETPG